MVFMEDLVMPGDKLGIEEEFAPSFTTYAEDGNVYSANVGTPKVSNGKMEVKNDKKNILFIKKGMLVTGIVEVDLGSVMFVSLDNIEVEGKRYIASMEGKIIVEKKRGFNKNSDSYNRDFVQCSAGDVILARIIDDDGDYYTLDLRGIESGVVHSNCKSCGSDLNYEGDDKLTCPNCKAFEFKKVSNLYNKPETIKSMV